MKKLFVIALTLAMSLSVLAAGSAGAVWMSDLDESNWAFESANDMVEQGIMELDHDGCFNPTVETSRGDFVVYLWRALAAEADVDVVDPTFTDVPRSSGYFTAVEWCAFAGITNGVGNGRFDLDGALTREMAFTFLYRAMDFIGVAPVYGDGHEMMKQITEFQDYEEVDSWAADSVQLLLDVGIVRGGGDYLWPRQDLNNAQTAALLCQYMDYLWL